MVMNVQRGVPVVDRAAVCDRTAQIRMQSDRARARAEQAQVDAESLTSRIRIAALDRPRDRARFAGVDFLDPYFLAATPPPALLQALLECITDATDVQVCDAQQVDAVHGGLRLVAHRGMSRPFLDYFAVVDGRGTACAQAARTGRPVSVGDVATSGLYSQDSRQVMLEAGSRAVRSVPLCTPGGPVMAMVSVHHRAPNGLRDVDTDLLGALARAAARALHWHH
ncbi:hypothetical protein GCM10010358_58270 [Streptomyces minutiscleroticus]|uniref:GAF domain-containing protein n=2 Tax=Streptomyces minutiscleroticus TaxID=68238 RepID=A0A918U5E7_9ACTN|nr:GAF domain-containing protein [Streptomyces minutiscleroticus]GGX96886.1 hypothetical protein GCM10010358_58270 [Streptomyces minutiscleroticus]